jgi:hypothetical protein
MTFHLLNNALRLITVARNKKIIISGHAAAAYDYLLLIIINLVLDRLNFQSTALGDLYSYYSWRTTRFVHVKE